MNNAEWMLKHGMKFSQLDVYGNQTNDHIIMYDRDDPSVLYRGPALDCVRPIDTLLNWLDMEYVPPILSDAEYDHLQKLMKPFADEVQYVARIRLLDGTRCLEIGRKNANGAACTTPFRIYDDRTYECLTLGRHYYPDELGE